MSSEMHALSPSPKVIPFVIPCPFVFLGTRIAVLKYTIYRVSYRGRGGLEFSPLEILKLSMVIILAIYMLLDISMCYRNVVVWKGCPRNNLRGFEFNILIGGGGGMPSDPPSRYSRISHITIILLPSCFPSSASSSHEP